MTRGQLDELIVSKKNIKDYAAESMRNFLYLPAGLIKKAWLGDGGRGSAGRRRERSGEKAGDRRKIMAPFSRPVSGRGGQLG